MKRIASLLLALLLVVNLCACTEWNEVLSTLPELTEALGGTDASTSATVPDSSVPDVTVPDQTDPDVTEPTVTEPATTAPNVTEPTPTEPAPTQPQPTQPTPTQPQPTEPEVTEPYLDPNGSYTTKEDVALYIHLYGKLPSNFITKSQAKKLGWSSGSLERYAPGKCIGGDTFQNREGLLPKKAGRTYKECDIGTLGASSRGSKRIVYSNDGLIYYTSDHYASFTLLYGEP